MAIKAQALANFVVEFMHDIAPEPEITSPEVETTRKSEQEDNLTRWKLFVDVSSNRHGCGVGLVLQTPSGKHMEYAIHIGFKATNNEAEYEALLTRLRVATELRVKSLNAFSDSQLIVNQAKRITSPKISWWWLT